MNHQEISELLGAFALDAVEPEEAEVVAAHVRECPRCQAEHGRHLEVAALLGNEWRPAPDGVWDRIAASLFEAPPEPAAVLPAPATGWRTGRASRRWLAWTGAGVAAAVIALLGVQVARLGSQVDDMSSQLRQVSLPSSVASALADPSARRTTLTSASGASTAEAVVLAGGRGYLVADRLPALPDTETYQLWTVANGRRVSLGLLGPRPGAVAFAMGPQTGATTLAVTAERAGGVVSSEHQPVVAGSLPS